MRRFAGCAELLGGFLLMFPRTVTLGALICLADLTQIFMLNMTYDVPVKLFSFHLILISLLILAPDVKRLANFFFLNRPAEPTRRKPIVLVAPGAAHRGSMRRLPVALDDRQQRLRGLG